MIRINVEQIKRQKVKNPLFTGIVELQVPFKNVNDADITIIYVHFLKGIHNKFHKHSTDQILLVTEGHGFISTEGKKYYLKPGDIVYSPAGEIHKHGAVNGHTFTHISITRSDNKITQVEK